MKILTSEEDLRRCRLQWLKKWQMDWEKKDRTRAVGLVFGHQAEDLLETRLMRLMRGVGPAGLESMSFYQDGVCRPLLGWQRSEVQDYVLRFEGNWLEDPSNKSDAYLRNWLRHHWLKMLEKRVPGATQALARSLQLLVASLKVTSFAQDASRLKYVQKQGVPFSFDRRQFMALGLVEQRSEVTRLLVDLRIKNYSFGHVEEILRRLDNRRESFTFTVLKHKWHVNAGRVIIERI